MSPKEQWLEAAKKINYPLRIAREKQEKFNEQMAEALAEMNEFLFSEEGKAALTMLIAYNKLVLVCEGGDWGCTSIYFGPKGFISQYISGGWVGTTSPAKEISVREAIKEIVSLTPKFKDPEPKKVLPLLKQRLDELAQEILRN